MSEGELYLTARIDGVAVALPSAAIESVIRIGEIVPVPGADPAIAGLLALRSRVLTLIDTRQRIIGAPSPRPVGALAVVAEIAQHGYGFLVDAVDDVVAIPREAMLQPVGLEREWAPFARALARVEDRLVLLLDLSALLCPQARLAA